MHLSEQNPTGSDSVTGRRHIAEDYSAEDAELAQRLLDILREEDPNAFITAGDVSGDLMAVDGHWALPVVVRRLRELMEPSQ
jgi:hypothetical protein